MSASVKSPLKNTGLRQAYQNLGSKLVTDHILTLIRNFHILDFLIIFFSTLVRYFPTLDFPGVFDEL